MYRSPQNGQSRFRRKRGRPPRSSGYSRQYHPPRVGPMKTCVRLDRNRRHPRSVSSPQFYHQNRSPEPDWVHQAGSPLIPNRWCDRGSSRRALFHHLRQTMRHPIWHRDRELQKKDPDRFQQTGMPFGFSTHPFQKLVIRSRNPPWRSSRYRRPRPNNPHGLWIGD